MSKINVKEEVLVSGAVDAFRFMLICRARHGQLNEIADFFA